MKRLMNRYVWVGLWSLRAALCCACGFIVFGAGSEGALRLHAAQAQQFMPGPGGEAALTEMLSGIAIPGAVSDLTTNLYSRHRAEITRIINDNPEMIWSTVDVALDALPSLRAAQENGGEMIIDKRIYGKATGLMDQYRSMASAGLATDLDRLKKYVDSRIVEMDSQRLRVNLR